MTNDQKKLIMQDLLSAKQSLINLEEALEHAILKLEKHGTTTKFVVPEDPTTPRIPTTIAPTPPTPPVKVTLTRQLRIGLIVGHNSINGGAKTDELGSEFEFWSYVAKTLAHLNPHDKFIINFIPVDGSYEDKQRSLKKYFPDVDIVLELHFNAFFTHDVGGHELLSVHDSLAKEKHAIKLNRALQDTYDLNFTKIRNRGVKRLTVDKNGYANITQGQRIINPPLGYFILEPFFATSTGDMQQLNEFAFGKDVGLSVINILIKTFNSFSLELANYLLVKTDAESKAK